MGWAHLDALCVQNMYIVITALAVTEIREKLHYYIIPELSCVSQITSGWWFWEPGLVIALRLAAVVYSSCNSNNQV